MSTFRTSTARLFLHQVPERERSALIRKVTNSLDPAGDAHDLEFVATLLTIHRDGTAEEHLLAFLESQVQIGRGSEVLPVTSRHPDLASQLNTRLLAALDSIVNRIQIGSRKWVTIDSQFTSLKISDESVSRSDVEGVDTADLMSRTSFLVDFVSRAISRSAKEDEHDTLFRQCVFLVGAAEQKLVKSAQGALFSLLSLSLALREEQTNLLWLRIQDLVHCQQTFYKTVGFALWLRWLQSSQTRKIALSQPVYWKLIIDGLGTGDTERRKAALQILRASVEAASNVPEALESLAETSLSSSTTIDSTQRQCDRFCTVFETIVFGRYINQVQECEADLDFLASPISLLKPVWLYTLLSSALDQRMQDSNRKFIGAWIMRSRPKLDDIEVFLDFFQHAFLPWVSSGTLYTSSLRVKDGVMRCKHGDALARYICDLITGNPSIADRIVNAILDGILARYGNNFAYAMVYLIDGIGRAFDKPSLAPLQVSQVEKMQRIAGWTGFPEIARDYILARSWKMCDKRNNEDMLDSPSASWRKLEAKVASMPPLSFAHIEGNIAALALDPSKRELQEREAIKKCLKLGAELDAESGDAASYFRGIDDIWGDLDYLEYPRPLLLVLPDLLLHLKLVKIALQHTSESKVLAEMIATRSQDLLELTKSRSYLVSPLVNAIRKVVLQAPASASLMNLEDVILQVANEPPSQTLDARLEDATTSLLHSLGPEMEKFSYEYYFGQREKHGFAAMLDIVNHLGSVGPDVASSLFYTILEIWRTQKIPPPTVSPWKTALQLQVMLICCEQHFQTRDDVAAKAALNHLHHILAIEPLPTYRYLLEWMIIRVYIHHPSLRSGLLMDLNTKDHHSNPKFLASLMKLGVMIAKTPGSDEAFVKALTIVFIPLAASSKVIIRHESQWQIPVLMDHARAQGWTSITNDTAFQALDEFIRSLERFGDPPLERQIDKLDPIKDHNITHLVEGPWFELDSVEQRRTDHNAFLSLPSFNHLPEPCMPRGTPIARPSSVPVSSVADAPSASTVARNVLQNIDNISRALGSGPVTPSALALQTKGSAYLSSSISRSCHPYLHIVASLIDNPHNLGGISRVGEIFGASKLYMSNTQVTSNKDFTNVSVSSHLHLPIEALPPAALQSFLSTQRRDAGYTVVGIEQTDRSVILGSENAVLPEKCILVLGSEREGIPANVLAECDLLLEIAQVGVTRSLNVQTAAGIALCEYGRQHEIKTSQGQ